MLSLRPYQERLYGSIRAAWSRVRVVLAVLATGGGKTVVFSAVMHDHDGAGALIAHRKEIVGQISQALGRLEVRHRVIAPPQVVTRIRRRHLKEFGKSFVDMNAEKGVVSVQTLTSKASGKDRHLQRWLSQVTLAVFDEGHHYVEKGLWAKAVHMFKRAKILKVTATPERADGVGLAAGHGGFVEEMVEGPSTQWLIVNGYLSPFTYRAPKSDLDVSDIPLTASGDLNTKAMRKRVVESHLVGDVVQQYRQYAAGRRAIVFATDVETAEELARAFQADGVAAAALSGETDAGERDSKIDEFEGGALDVLVNVDLFDEGFDVPGVEVVILARPTESLAKFLQMIGRGLRPVYATGFDLSTVDGRRAAIATGSKPSALVIDPVRNWERHGMPNWPRQWDLRGRSKDSRGPRAGLVPQRVCLDCTQPYERFYLECPYCGAPAPEPEGRSAPEVVDGDLMELDIEAMSALFAKMERADMDDNEYAADQIARRIPAVGRPADMRRHREAKYRRKVLRELVGWWVGMQPPDRPRGEVYRRFYHRFGVDMASAFTLKASETDALIEKMKQRFTEDLAE